MVIITRLLVGSRFLMVFGAAVLTFLDEDPRSYYDSYAETLSLDLRHRHDGSVLYLAEDNQELPSEHDQEGKETIAHRLHRLVGRPGPYIMIDLGPEGGSIQKVLRLAKGLLEPLNLDTLTVYDNGIEKVVVYDLPGFADED